MAVCGSTIGSTLPTNLVIKGGNLDTGHACTAAFTYDVGAVDIQKN